MPEGDQQLTYSGGVVFCHRNAPIHAIKKLASDLGEQAKNRAKKKAGGKGNFAIYQALESFDSIGEDVEGFLGRRYGFTEGRGVFLGLEEVALIEDNMEYWRATLSRRKLHTLAQGLEKGKPMDETSFCANSEAAWWTRGIASLIEPDPSMTMPSDSGSDSANSKLERSCLTPSSSTVNSSRKSPFARRPSESKTETGSSTRFTSTFVMKRDSPFRSLRSVNSFPSASVAVARMSVAFWIFATGTLTVNGGSVHSFTIVSSSQSWSFFAAPPAMDCRATFSSTVSPSDFCFGSSRMRTARRASFSLIAHASASTKLPWAS